MEKKIPKVPLTEHHMRAQKIFLEAARRGDITYEEADQLYLAWLRRRRGQVRIGRKAAHEDTGFGKWLERQIDLPPEEFNEAWPQWWGEGIPALQHLSPLQIRLLRMLRPTMHHARAMRILDTAVERGLLSHAEAGRVYMVWTSLRRVKR
ncbi:MAG: hypothetical protein JRD89_13915 [Deltaproteobacteria bacterium]|nr:hypothetical protein [Deltaproteobacteria bacterium]